MKVTIEDEHDVISGAFAIENEHSLSLFINTQKRYTQPDASVHGCGAIEYWFDVDEDTVSKVILSAENNEEKEKLSRISFDCHEKDQLWFLFPGDKVINYENR